MMLNEETMAELKPTLATVLESANLNAAWEAVKANEGAPGPDGKNIQTTGKHIRENRETILAKLSSGAYNPGPIRAVIIPKPNGGERQLGVPNVQDRWIQQAVHQKLSERCELSFSDHSYGFRPNRSAHDAVRAAKKYIDEGKKYVVDIDLKAFFDEVNHDILMNLVGEYVEDKALKKLIGKILRAPIQREDGSRYKRGKGTPQGGPLSPLLANIYLDPLDKELESRGLSFVRYADDIAIFVSSPRAAERILESVITWIEKRLKVPLNREKSGSGPTDESSLLGFRLHSNGETSVAPKNIQRLKAKVRELWDARQSRTSNQLRDQWRRYIIGWWNYFQLATNQRDVKDTSGWIRRHIRKCFWLRWKTPRGRLNALKRLGIKYRALGIAYTRAGAWPIAKSPPLQQALSNKTLERYGFIIPWNFAQAPSQ